MMMIVFRIPHQITKLLQLHVVQRSHLQNRLARSIVKMPQQPVCRAMAAL